MKKARCPDCGVAEGQIHHYGCNVERCPFCGRQLIACECVYQHLNLRDREKWNEETACLPEKVYFYGLTETHKKQWLSILKAKGRVPYIQYPVICGKCGKLWPEFFRVPDEEWKRYIQKNERHIVLCRPCYNYIKKVIDKS